MKKSLFIGFIALMAIYACDSEKKGNSEEDSVSEEVEETVKDEIVEEIAGPNSLTKKEKEEGWKLLFDGKTTEGWRGYKKESFPAAWNIDKNALHIQGSGRGEAGAQDGGDIVYEKEFADFHLKLEWLVDSAANSGILYRGKEKYDYIWKTAPEMQVLDNKHHPDAKLGKDGNRKAGSLYDLIPAEPQNFKGHGTWNKAEIIAKGNDIVHIQNGDTIVQYTIGSDEMAELIADSKWAELEENDDWGNIAPKGYIALQDHGDDVWFRNIKIKEMK
ncbi:MAG: 3-keto-disaccharide hydrolase [Bacteroidota bacterium]